MAHMGRYTYSPTGALKWKKDVAEYAEALRGYGVPAVDEEMASLEQVGWRRLWEGRRGAAGGRLDGGRAGGHARAPPGLQDPAFQLSG
jgi:hypothetical protein